MSEVSLADELVAGRPKSTPRNSANASASASVCSTFSRRRSNLANASSLTVRSFSFAFVSRVFNRGLHLAHGLLEHHLRVFHAFHQLTQIRRDDVADSFEQPHRRTPFKSNRKSRRHRQRQSIFDVP